MLTRKQKGLNMFEGNACNCSCPTWKPTFRVMTIKVSQITPWVHVQLLPREQRKWWISIGLMGCVHTHRIIPAIVGWRIVEKTGEVNQKVGKSDQVINHIGP
jgi:hypothetical protein